MYKKEKINARKEVLFTKSDIVIIERAARFQGVTTSSFIRVAAIEKARTIINFFDQEYEND